MDDRGPVVVNHDANLDGGAGTGWADEHRDGRVVSLEGSPVMAHSVQHVLVGDTVLAGACLDVHPPSR